MENSEAASTASTSTSTLTDSLLRSGAQTYDGADIGRPRSDSRSSRSRRGSRSAGMRSFTVGRTDVNRRVYTRSELPWYVRLRERIKSHWNKLRTPMEEEGLDFEEIENDVDMLRNQENLNLERMRWMNAGLIAFVVSAAAILIDVCIDLLATKKFQHVSYLLETASTWKAFVFFLLLNMGLVAVAALLVAFLDNRAKGSGIPEVKSYLNGRKIHRVISLRTLFTKLVGVVLCVGGSMIVGKEGPMIHAGAILGAVISQGKAETRNVSCRLFPFHLMAFRNDSEKSNFVAIGCACGVAAAFSAPLGAVLFVIEEAASYWSVMLMWRTFFACILCVSIVDVVLSGMKDNADWGVMSQSAVVSFGSFEGASKGTCYPEQPPYRIYELPAFMLIGVVGGLMGAFFNQCNLMLTRIRFKYINNPFRRMLEALILSVLTSCMIFGLNWVYQCRSVRDAKFAITKGSDPSVSGIHQTCDNLGPAKSFCSSKNAPAIPYGYVASFNNSDSLLGRKLDVYFSDYETLSFGRLDSAVHHLFHSELVFEPQALLLYGSMLWMLACLTYGANIPSGIFVPVIAAGACFGRLTGQLLWESSFVNSGEMDPGTYGLVGAAALLGGVTRMTISIVVILVETTNNSTYAVPIMIAIMTAKVCGDFFSRGIYDIHVDFQGIKFLHDMPHSSDYACRASDKMVPNPITFKVVERVSDVLKKLQDCSHNGFPVVNLRHHSEQRLSAIRYRSSIIQDAEISVKAYLETRHRSLDEGGAEQLLSNLERVLDPDETIFEGMILRKQILILLWEKAFEPYWDAEARCRTSSPMNLLSWRTFYQYYPRNPTIQDVVSKLSFDDYEKVLDLRPYLNSAALTVHHSVNMSRVHLLFRALGLRHLTVVNTANNVIGIITRHELCDHDHDHEPDEEEGEFINHMTDNLLQVAEVKSSESKERSM